MIRAKEFLYLSIAAIRGEERTRKNVQEQSTFSVRFFFFFLLVGKDGVESPVDLVWGQRYIGVTQLSRDRPVAFRNFSGHVCASVISYEFFFPPFFAASMSLRIARAIFLRKIKEKKFSWGDWG